MLCGRRTQKEHEALREEQPTYEIATYTMLVQMATGFGERVAAKLLRENLNHEKVMAKRVTAIRKELGKAVKAKAKGATRRTATTAR